ncbi:MAG TPA: hypothetical protein VHB49_08835 [Bradyrhizobium sp.]|nr:hypothetical protein [Bradyrhizobium sp.]
MLSSETDCDHTAGLAGDKDEAGPYRELTDAEVAALVREIDRSGYAVLRQYVPQEDIDQLRGFVRETVAAAGGSYAALTGYSPIANTALGGMTNSVGLKSIFRRAYELAASTPAKDEGYHQVLRCLTGDLGQKNSLLFHFDSYVVTALLPIEVPAGKNTGELILLRNVRPIRKSYLTNLADKVALDNPLTQRVLRNMAAHNVDRFIKLPMVPGDLYFFWGYRSVHTNLPCDADKVRATALFHFGDPHCDSRLKHLLRR